MADCSSICLKALNPHLGRHAEQNVITSELIDCCGEPQNLTKCPAEFTEVFIGNTGLFYLFIRYVFDCRADVLLPVRADTSAQRLHDNRCVRQDASGGRAAGPVGSRRQGTVSVQQCCSQDGM